MSKSRNLYIFSLCIMTIAIIMGYYYRYNLLFIIEQLQRGLNRTIATSFVQLKDQQQLFNIQIICFSFIYGIIHALGPGHGKLIISSYILTQENNYKSSIFIAMASSLLQSIVAICLVSVIMFGLQLSKSYLQLSELWLTKLSFLVFILLGVFILVKHCSDMFQKPLATKHHCHHIPIVTAENLDKRKIILTIFAAGIRPCSGSLLLLTFTYSIGMYLLGIVAVFLVALGVSFSLIMIALLTYFYKNRLLSLTDTNRFAQVINVILQICIFLFAIVLIVVGSYLLIYYQPVKPIFGSIR